ncbi:MAG TPA: NUDIX domain-containing protein [Anaerolineae bacterium]|nr:NUDIX domain-containing protein [Anaerolineae bacterium]
MAKESPQPAVTVDVVIFTLKDDDLQVLLVKRKLAPYAGRWAIPGGFLGGDEPLEAAARRELEEETGVRDVYLEQLYTFGDPKRDPRGRVITVAYFALVPAPLALQAGSDASAACWWSMYALPALAFDHAKILDYALTRLRYKLEYTAVGFQLLPATFTLSELQQAYQIILGVQLDKRNFRRKILEAQVIEETDEYRTGEGRPAMLYRFRPDAVAETRARRLFP